MPELERRVLDAIVDFYVSNGKPTPLDHVILSGPVEETEQLKTVAFGLAKGEFVDVGGLPSTPELTPTYAGLLLSSQSAAVATVANRFLSFFKNRLRDHGVKFRTFTFAELLEARVVRDTNEYPLALAVLRAFHLYSGGTSSEPGAVSPTGSWNVPYDVVNFRTFADVDRLQARVAARRLERIDSLEAVAAKIDRRNPMPKHPRDVFVVHGRNGVIRDAVFDFLRSVGLNPMEWEADAV